MQQPSRTVTSNQPGTHPALTRKVARHLKQTWQRPLAAHSQRAFAGCAEKAASWPGPVILDAGCGTGASSLQLAMDNPQALVLGVDKSAARLGRGVVDARPENLLLLRADLVDFWRLAQAAGWQLARHCVFYPNPWPKPGHLGRRWHAHPVFPTLLALGGELELRTNWETYAREWQQALTLHGRAAALDSLDAGRSVTVVSPFERKYLASGQRCWRVRACAPPADAGGC
ncbi:MAG: SAM-dependent methyltransferase [Gammaproteobacteria bacterium]|nr:SAM-dependent methyltransferase [Gammaproteobacteria bacterium]